VEVKMFFQNEYSAVRTVVLKEVKKISLGGVVIWTLIRRRKIGKVNVQEKWKRVG
jgi:hypothetical protein